MSLFGRPTIPAGGHPFVSQDDVDGTRWTARVQMPGEEPTPHCVKVHGAPTFRYLVNADAWLQWAIGNAATFIYPPGEA